MNLLCVFPILSCSFSRCSKCRTRPNVLNLFLCAVLVFNSGFHSILYIRKNVKSRYILNDVSPSFP